MPAYDESEHRTATPGPVVQDEYEPEITSPDGAEITDVLDALDSALLSLESLLGATRQWDVDAP